MFFHSSLYNKGVFTVEEQLAKCLESICIGDWRADRAVVKREPRKVGISMGSPAEGQRGWLGWDFQDLGNYFTREIGKAWAPSRLGRICNG